MESVQNGYKMSFIDQLWIDSRINYELIGYDGVTGLCTYTYEHNTSLCSGDISIAITLQVSYGWPSWMFYSSSIQMTFLNDLFKKSIIHNCEKNGAQISFKIITEGHHALYKCSRPNQSPRTNLYTPWCNVNDSLGDNILFKCQVTVKCSIAVPV